MDDVWGWDFVNEDAEPMDDHGHGTHCAGTIAATTNNGMGIAALLWQGKVMAVKGLNDDGTGTSSGLARAIKYAADMGADVLSNSWGATGYERGVTLPPIAEAIEYAHASGCVFVAAAGNSYCDVSYVFPANHPLSIAVAAVDWESRKPDFSCYGSDVDVAAPGVNVLSLYAANSPMGKSRLVGEKYCYVSGTSMACPHAAGVAALIVAKYPDITSDQVRQILRASAGPPPPEESTCVGRGILDAKRALEINIPPPDTAAEITSPKYEMYVSANSLQVVGTAIGNRYELEYNTSFYRADGWALVASGDANIRKGVLANWDIAALPESSYVLRLSVYWGDSEDNPPLRAYSSFLLDRLIKDGWATSSAIEKSFWTSPLVADLNGDGKKEIVVADANQIFMYTFDGKIAEGWPFTVGGGTLRQSTIAAADLDKDGDLELIFTSTDKIWAMHHDGTLVTGWPVQRFFMLTHIAVADLTGDGDIEIVGGWYTSNSDASNVECYIAVFNADGTLEEGWPIHFYSYFPTAGFAVGDIDKDGKCEIAFSIAGRGLYVYNHDGTPCDGWPQRWHDTYHSATAPIMADFDYDGEVEILFVEESELRIYKSDGTLMPGWPYDMFFQIHAPAACGDLDGDGDLEIIFGPGIRAETANKLYALHHNGTPVAGWPAVIEGKEPFGSGFRRPGATIADFDRDGRQEVIFPSSKISPVNVYAFRDNGTRVPPWPKQVGDTTVALETCPAISDLEGDGKMEVVVATVTRGLVVWEIQPTGTAATKLWWPTEGQNISRTNYIAPTRSLNRAPLTPTLNGPSSGVVRQAIVFSAVATDPDGDSLKYTFDWGDGTSTTTPLLSSGTEGVSDHTYSTAGNYAVKAKATDGPGLASEWSAPITLSVTEAAVEIVTTTTANTRTYLGYSSSYAQQAQSFKAVGDRISRVTVALAKYGSPTGDITVSIRSSMSGSNLASTTLSRQAVTSTNYLSPTWVDVTFPGGVAVTPGNTYYLVLRASGYSYSAYYHVPLNSGNPYASGSWYSSSSGTVQTSYDLLLKIAFGTAGNTSPNVPTGWAPYYTGKPNQAVNLSLNVTDPDGDRVALSMDWGDGTKSQSAWAASGTSIPLSHTWPNEGTYLVRGQALDEKGAASAWSATVEVRISLASEETLVISDTSTTAINLGYNYLFKRQSQSFKAIGSTIQKVSIPLAKMGLPYSSITVSIRASVSGPNLASGTIASSQVVSTNANSPALVTLTFVTPAQVTAGSTYFLVLEANSYSTSNYYRIGVNTANPYPYGMWYQDTTSNSGVDLACKITFLK